MVEVERIIHTVCRLTVWKVETSMRKEERLQQQQQQQKWIFIAGVEKVCAPCVWFEVNCIECEFQIFIFMCRMSFDPICDITVTHSNNLAVLNF